MGATKKERNTLYIRLPVKIKDELQVKELHPSISVVHLPRQKSRRWCTIDFDTKSQLEQVKTELRKLKIDGKPIVVKNLKIPKKKDSLPDCLVMDYFNQKKAIKEEHTREIKPENLLYPDNELWDIWDDQFEIKNRHENDQETEENTEMIETDSEQDQFSDVDQDLDAESWFGFSTGHHCHYPVDNEISEESENDDENGLYSFRTTYYGPNGEILDVKELTTFQTPGVSSRKQDLPDFSGICGPG